MLPSLCAVGLDLYCVLIYAAMRCLPRVVGARLYVNYAIMRLSLDIFYNQFGVSRVKCHPAIHPCLLLHHEFCFVWAFPIMCIASLHVVRPAIVPFTTRTRQRPPTRLYMHYNGSRSQLMQPLSLVCDWRGFVLSYSICKRHCHILTCIGTCCIRCVHVLQGGQ